MDLSIFLINSVFQNAELSQYFVTSLNFFCIGLDGDWDKHLIECFRLLPWAFNCFLVYLCVDSTCLIALRVLEYLEQVLLFWVQWLSIGIGLSG